MQQKLQQEIRILMGNYEILAHETNPNRILELKKVIEDRIKYIDELKKN